MSRLKGREAAMARRVFMSLLAAVAVMLSAGSASAAFFAATDMGGDVFQITLNGESGDPSGGLADFDIHSLVIVGATVVSVDITVSAFFKPNSVANFNILDPNTVILSGTDFTRTIPFDPAATIVVGNLQLSGAPTEILLGDFGLYTAHLGDGGFVVSVPISQTSGDVLFTPEPATLLLLGLGLAGFAFVRHR